MGQFLLSRPTLRRWLVPGPLVVLLLIGAVVTWADPDAGEAVGFLGIVIGLYTGAVLFMRRSRPLPKRERGAWVAMGWTLILVGTGVLLVGVLTTIGIELPAFGPLDVFLLGGYAVMVYALTRWARADAEGPDWLLTFLDGAVGAIALSALVWTALYTDLIDALAGAPWYELATAATYPILDVVAVIALMILVIRRSNFHFDLRLVLLAGGLSLQILADFSFLNSGVGMTFSEAQPAWTLNLLAVAFLVSSAAIADRAPRRREFPQTEAPLTAVVWPYLFAAGLLTVHVVSYRSLEGAGHQVVLLDAVLAVGAVIFLRQMVVIHRNRVRVEQQRSEVVGSVSHELRTPLTAIVGYLTLLDDDPEGFPEDARREMIKEASDSARHMSRLVSDLLMLAKGTNRQLSLEKEKVTVSSMVNSSLRMIETGVTPVSQEISVDGDVVVDTDRIEQALGNLVTNAVRYGGGRVLVTAGVDGSALSIEVHDDGPGVPTRYEAMIWRRFERGAHRLDATTPGLGIGLAIVRAVADSHGGIATYRRSERLGGACFSIRIPEAAERRRIGYPIEVAH